VSYLEAVHSFPAFLVHRFVARYGRGGAGELMTALNRPAPVVLRATGRGNAEDLIGRLELEGIHVSSSPWLPGALRVDEGHVQHSAAFRQGAFYIQDEAAQMVADLLRPLHEGAGFLDLCAAPGGKFLSLVETRPDRPGPLVAADLSRSRLQRLGSSRCALLGHGDHPASPRDPLAPERTGDRAAGGSPGRDVAGGV
jgi:16S rRNA (cytosine967-C5)-methyltransferase